MNKNYYYSVFLLFLANILPAQSVLRVKPDATGTNDGTSWQNAFTDLHTALAAAQSGDQIWVAEGVYFPTNGTDRDQHFTQKSGTQLYGGFAGTEQSPEERDWEAHPTILSGDIGIAADTTDNSFCVLYVPQPAMGTSIEGFFVENGTAIRPTSTLVYTIGASGAGIFVDALFKYVHYSVSHCTFRNNAASGFGAAVYVNAPDSTYFNLASVANVRFSHCTFEKNTSSQGGAILIWGTNTTTDTAATIFDNCRFINNYASDVAGALQVITTENDKIVIKNCHFEGNKAKRLGGCMVAESGGTFQLKGNTFLKNQAALGGALFFRDVSNKFAAIHIDSCVFKENRSYSETNLQRPSSAIELQADLYGCDINIQNSQFLDNYGLWTMGIYNGYGGGKTRFIRNIFKGDLLGSELANSDSLIVVNNHFLDCGELPNFRVDYNSKRFFFHQNIIENCFIAPQWSFQAGYITNNVFANNTFSVFQPASLPDLVDTAIVVANNIFWNNQNLSPMAGVNWGLPLLNVKTHLYNNIFDFGANETLPQYWELKTGNRFGENPLFVDTMAGNFRVLPCSPVRNSGSNNFVWGSIYGTSDFYGQARTQGGQIDIGLSELPGLSPVGTAQTTSACTGQLNGGISLTVQDGCEPLQFNWTSSNTAQGTELTGLAAGQYSITVTDNAGQTLVFPAVTVATDSVPVTASVTNASCDTCSNGNILVTPAPGYGPYTYAWSNGDLTNNPTSLPVGTYTVTVTNANGCTSTAHYTVDFTVGTNEGVWTNLRTYPNPVTRYFYIAAEQPLGPVYLTDLNGRVVARSEQQGTTARIDVSELANGIYFWQTGTNYRGKLVVQH